VLPYGCPDEPPSHPAPVLKGVHPAVGKDDIVITWGGGTWEWFDPVMVLEAFVKAHAMEPRLRLFFMGLDQASGTGVPRMKVAQQLRDRAEELGLTDTGVIFGNWAPYDERGAYLLESDMGVIATKDLAEVRLAFRSRLLDHFWIGLPTIATEGDVLADVVRGSDAGIVVPIGDEAALAAAMVRLATDTELRARQQANAAALGDQYRWTRSVEVLRPLLENPSRFRAIRRERPRSRQLDLREDTQVLLLRRRGMIDQYARYTRIFERLKRSRAKPLLKWGYERARSVKRLLTRS
jgi:glycosyltransferase involved in cell wall biosynthesis